MTIKIMITLEGGLVGWVGTTSQEDIEVLIVDYDTDGCDPDDPKIYDNPQDNGSTAEAYAHCLPADNSDPEFIERAWFAFEEQSEAKEPDDEEDGHEPN